MLVGCLRGCGTPCGVVGFDPRRDVTRPVCRAAANTLCWVVGRAGSFFASRSLNLIFLQD